MAAAITPVDLVGGWRKSSFSGAVRPAGAKPAVRGATVVSRATAGGSRDLSAYDKTTNKGAALSGDATLRAIADKAPQDLADLEGISGMGSKKLHAYGAEVIRVCTALA